MAYDRYDTRNAPRDERSRWRDDRGFDRSSGRERGYSGGGRRDERGFFERAGDEIASWFGDDEAERRRRDDQSRDETAERGGSDRWSSPDRSREYGRSTSAQRDRDWNRDRDSARGRYEDVNEDRGLFSSGRGNSERDYNPEWRNEYSGSGRDMERNEERDRWVEQNNRDFGRRSAEHGRDRSDYSRDRLRDRDENRQRGYQRDYDQERDRGLSGSGSYRPLTGDYGRSSDLERGSQSNWARDEYRETSRFGSANKSDRSREDRFDPHYRSWRDRHLSEIDRDYDDYRAENQSRFESDFAGWRERRQQKRGLLGQVREHMEVVGSDDKHVGTVDKAAGDRLILTKSDAESGGIHHSISCSDIDRIEGDKVILGCSADQARDRWRDESRGRALFERDDQGEMGPRMLDRSFEGTYR